MLSKFKKKPSPKLEDLRKKGLEPPRIEYDINQIIEKSNNVHAGWLFHYDHLFLLQKLLIYLDGNFDSINTPGWSSFGNQLGISNEILRVIECSKLGNEGYTYYVLQHYIQKNDATIQKIVQALIDLKRFDVIHETQSHFNSLLEKVLDYPDEEDSGISLSSNEMIRPDFIPTPALILRELEEQVQLASSESITSTSPDPPGLEDEAYQTSDISRVPRNRDRFQESPKDNCKKVIPKYDCKVMLTFAMDGIDYATDAANMLRAKREDGLSIGVLILNDHEKIVSSNPELFISGSFPQVDYVVPIITKGYLQAVMNTKSPVYDESLYLDCRYVRFIYTLMSKYYVQSGCLNKKIRCIIPDELTHLTKKTLMKEPIFETWVKSSSIKNLAERMLRRSLRKRFYSQQMVEA